MMLMKGTVVFVVVRMLQFLNGIESSAVGLRVALDKTEAFPFNIWALSRFISDCLNFCEFDPKTGSDPKGLIILKLIQCTCYDKTLNRT